MEEIKKTSPANERGPHPAPEFGRILREARLRAGLSIADVEAATRIHSPYIEAVENEDYSFLPPAVYIIAYVRKLGAFYGMDAGDTAKLVEELRRHLEYKVPEEFINRLEIDTEGSAANEKKLKQMFLIASSLIGVFLLLIIALVIYWAIPSSPDVAEQPPIGTVPSQQGGSSAAAEKSQFDSARLLTLIPEPDEVFTILEPVPGNQ